MASRVSSPAPTGSGNIEIRTAKGGTIGGPLPKTPKVADADHPRAQAVQTSAVDGDTAIYLGDTVSGGTVGVDATATGDGDITIVTDAPTTGNQGATVSGGTAEGIKTTSLNGATTITLGAAVTGATDGVSATRRVRVVPALSPITSTAAITGGTGAGVKATANGGAIDIGGTNGLSGAVEGTTGISAINTGSGNINVKTTTNGTVTGKTGEGVKTTAVTGATTIALGAAVSGETKGVSATASGAGAITVTSNSAITGGTHTGDAGVYANSQGGNVDIGGTAGLSGAVTGAQGIVASTTSGGTVNVKTTTDGTVTGSDAEGIKTTAATGATTITVGAAVSGATAGISATSTTGQITVTGSGDVSGTGTNAAGILATSTSGAITISGAGKTEAKGTANAIDAQITGTGTNGTITISRSGEVKADSGFGIYVSNAGSGAIKLEGIGKVTSTSAAAIYLNGNGDIDVGTSTTKLSGAISGTTGIDAQTTGSGQDFHRQRHGRHGDRHDGRGHQDLRGRWLYNNLRWRCGCGRDGGHLRHQHDRPDHRERLRQCQWYRHERGRHRGHDHFGRDHYRGSRPDHSERHR